MYPEDDIFYPIPDYRTQENTCKWCGQPLKNKRQRSYCSSECSRHFNNLVVWNRGTAPLPYRIMCRDNFTCMDCGEFKAYKNEHGMFIPIDTGLEVHHIIWVSNGGSDQQSNLITLCKECHRERHKVAL